MKFGKLLSVITLIVTSFLFACSPSEGIGGVRVLMTDFPLGTETVDQVLVNVESVEIIVSSNSNEGWITIEGDTYQYNLLGLTNGLTTVIGEAQIPAGRYNQIRININESNYIKFVGDTNLYDLVVPSGTETGVKLTGSFVVEADIVTEIMVDFDAQQSVNNVSGGYILQPTIEVIKTQTTNQ